MKKLTLLGLCLLMTGSAFAQASQKLRIASYVDVTLGGDIGQYEETLSYSRNETRRMYMDEVINAALVLSQGQFSPTGMLGPLQKLQEAADRRRDINKEIDGVGVGYSMGEFFKGEIEKLHKKNGIVKSERKIEFINVFQRKSNGQVIYNQNAQFDHYMSLHVAHLGSGFFRIIGTLSSFDTVEVSYDASGTLMEALSEVSESVFRSVMEDARPAWSNPNPHLKWIPGPKGLQLDVQEAKAYCLGQEARLPLAEELILAHQATAYRNGGIDRFNVGDYYHVGDQRRQAGVAMSVIYTVEEKVVVQALAAPTAKVWCVKGAPSDRNVLVKKLFSIRRKLDPKGFNIRFFPEKVPAANLLKIKALESLLISLGVMDANLGETLATEDFLAPDEALNILKAGGEQIYIPASVLNSLVD